MRLPDDTEVSSELWDEVIECMKLRVGDKVPVIRTFAVRGVSRFASDLENSDILELLLQTLSLEQNPVSYLHSFYAHWELGYHIGSLELVINFDCTFVYFYIIGRENGSIMNS